MSELSRDTCSAPSRTSTLLAKHSVTLVGLLIGVLYLVLGLAHGDAIFGVVGLGIMVVYVTVLHLWRRRSETAQLLGGLPSDERQARVLLQASATTGQVLSVVVIGALLVSLALDSRFALAFGALGAVGGVTFIAAVAWFSRRG